MIHLAGRTHFSVGESLLTPAELVEKAAEAGYKAVALTDTMSVSGAPEFIAACRKRGVKPILGCRLRVVGDIDYRPPAKKALELPKPNPEWFPKVFVLNEEGYRDLLGLLTLANGPRHFYYAPRVGVDDLIAALSRGNLAFSTGDSASLFAVVDFSDYALETMRRIKSVSSQALQCVVELFPAQSLAHDKFNAKATRIANDLGLPMIASFPSLYADDAHAETLEVMGAISSQGRMSDPWLRRPYVRDFSIKPLKERFEQAKLTDWRLERQRGVPGYAGTFKEALRNSVAFANSCKFVPEKMPISLPVMAPDETGALISLVKEGWRKRMFREVLGHKPDPTVISIYKQRLEYELQVLKKMGFERYFLLVRDIVQWSKENGILVGPGRGSCFLAGHNVVLDKSGVTKQIEDIRVGDSVLSHDGSEQKVIATLEFERDEEIIELEFDNGVRIACTKDHLFLTKNRGWVRAEEIGGEDEFDDVAQIARGDGS